MRYSGRYRLLKRIALGCTVCAIGALGVIAVISSPGCSKGDAKLPDSIREKIRESERTAAESARRDLPIATVPSDGITTRFTVRPFDDWTMREAAAVDGASEVKTFFSVIFPVMRPINMIVLVIVVIESLRAFDLVWVVNKGRNGLEIIAALVSQNVIGEATRYGFGSALAVIMMLISSIFITIYLRIVFKEDRA